MLWKFMTVPALASRRISLVESNTKMASGAITAWRPMFRTPQVVLPVFRSSRTNAVIGVRYDATEISDGVTEVLCYGTAVRVEKL